MSPTGALFEGAGPEAVRWAESLAALGAGQISEFALELRLLDEEARPFWISLTAYSCKGGDGEILVIATDISDRMRLQEAARQAESKFRNIYENISEGVYRSSPDGRQLAANPSLVRLNGYESEAAMLAGVRDIATEWYVDPGRRAEFQRILFEKGRVESFISEVYRHKTRERIWVEENAHLVRDEVTGSPLYYEGTVREVTATVQQLMLHDRLQKIGAVICACLFQFRRHANGHLAMPYAGLGLEPLFGVAPQMVREDASDLLAVIHAEDRNRLEHSLARSAARMTPWNLEFRVNHPERGTIWLSGRAVPDREGDGSILWHGFISDVTAIKSNERQIYELAYFDSLTGLPNRQMLRDRLRMALAASRRNGSHGALLFIDLDNFKLINDTHGHDVGDLLLVSIAQRLRQCLREVDTVARLGGDEFVVLLQDLGDSATRAMRHAETVARKVLEAIDQPCLLNGRHFQTTCSVGLTLVEGEGADSDEVLKRADLAMYEAKAAGRNALRFFAPRMQKVVSRRAEAVSELRRALDEREVGFDLEGQFDLDGQCRGAELILHWQRGEEAPMGAAELTALAEEGGLGESLSRLAVESACRILAQWDADPERSQLSLSLNVSPRLFSEPGLLRLVGRLLRQSGANPRRLKLEVSEGVMKGDLTVAADKMRRLRALGVRVVLDDFGSGLVALGSAKLLPFDEIKIASSYVHGIEESENHRAVARTILRIARSLDVVAVAGGVRTSRQIAELSDAGCRLFQGPAFAPAVSFERFDAEVFAARGQSAARQSGVAATG
ncbi:bifunctional diguanylate cyclase/phosphodiesterase [Afifella sp. IM 167]|uniref:putative bifunctional diguanylate cyclase/phosphodiesterase n=1 Tax=Afifella sp. IM 167 TaxID=2033586 RepID=UPI001CCF5D3C|nr:EAL domain-containing protein [Afifella sp. IM 167]